MSTSAAPARTNVRDLAYISLMAALISVCSWIVIPLGPVPFTLQTFGVFAALGLLGGRRGTLAVLLYLLLGLVGLPVFAGFSAGAGALLGVTGGYLLGFLASSLVYWAVTDRLGTRLPIALLAMILGLAACYAFGTLWFVRVYTSGGNTATLLSTLTLCVFPFILPDLIKLGLALLVARRVGSALNLTSPVKR
ncbi:MAG: biotin transporter BioY [Ruminiclostridium sp.]|nr:biotin transporter BioY [Ruminiclostridium sp.]